VEAPVVRRAARRRRRHGSRARAEEESIAAKDSATMSRQVRKSAAAARNLLKVDAARVDKAAAARKDVAHPSEQSSCGAAHLPEQWRPGGGGPVGAYGAATPPSLFMNASCLFNSQSWILSQSSDPATGYCLLHHSCDVCLLLHSFLPYATWYCLLLHF